MRDLLLRAKHLLVAAILHSPIYFFFFFFLFVAIDGLLTAIQTAL